MSVQKVWFSIFFIMLSLDARENPFFPSETVKKMPVTSNTEVTFDPLKRAAVSLPDSARVVEKVTIQYKNLDGSISQKSVELGQSIDWHLPLFISQSYASDIEPKSLRKTKKTTKTKILASYKFISFKQRNKKMMVQTDDKLIRSFMLTSPHRIILDFKRDADFRSYEKKITANPFVRIRMGNHKGYYRVVLELDGQYRYKKKVSQQGVELSCY